MEENENTISQDDSGFLRAGRLIAYSNKVDKPLNTIGYSDYSGWIDDNNLRFGVSSRDEMRTLKADIINGEYPVDEVRDIYERMFGDDPGGKSIAQKTGNYSEFTDAKGEYGVFEDDYEYETVNEDETDDDEDEVGSEDEDETQAVDKDFSLDVYRVLPESGEEGDDFEGNMLGFAVDFPNSDVYVEWNNKIFPDPLDDGHVSIYSSLDDLTTATGNETELVETISQPDTVEKGRVYVNSPEKVPDGYSVEEGPRGGYYYEIDEDVDISDAFSDLSYNPEDIETQILDTEIDTIEFLEDLNSKVGPRIVQTLANQVGPNLQITGDVLLDAVSTLGLSEEYGREIMDEIVKQSIEGYPSLPPEDAAPEAKEFVQRVAEEGHDDNEALLYQLLGSGTPEWKMSKEDAGYKDEPEDNMVCSNCQYYYVGTDGEAVCSKVRGEVFPEHWCELWEPGDDTNVSKGESFVPLNINGEPLLVEEADTQEKRYMGLSKYDSLDNIDGMIFNYPREEAHRLVWRDMSFPVDVIHVDKSNEVVETGSLEGEGDFVQAVSKTALEVPHGFVSKNDIEVGQTIQSLAKGSDSRDSLFEKIVSSSYHRDRKVRQRGEQLSLDVVERIDEAFREQVWPDEIQKSPSWQDDSDVDEETQEWVEAVLDMKDPMWDEYDGVPMAAGMTVKQEIRDSITQPQGWSLDSIVDRLDDEFPNLEEFNKRRIARQEVAGVLNGAKITALLAQPSDPKVKWVGPDDADTTDLCEEVKSEVEGGVPVSELVELLEEKADNFEGGTPRRAEEGLPHYLCRHTVKVVNE